MILNIKNSRLFIVFTLIIFSVIYLISLFNLQDISYLILFPLIIGLFILKKEFIIILYLIVLPTAGIIPSEANFMEAFGLDEIVNIIIIFYFMRNDFIKEKINSIQKNLTTLLYFMILLTFFLNLKNAFFEIYDGEFFLVLKRTLFVTLKYFPIVFIIRYLNDIRLRQNIILGLLLSGIVLVISQIFTEHLSSINLITVDDSEFGYFPSDVVNRFSGFYNGDPNSLGAYLTMLVGILFIMFNNNKKSIHLYFLIIFFISGVFITASRTAIISLALIFLLFLYYNNSKRFSLQLILIMLIPTYFSFDFIINQLSRFETASVQLSTSVEGNRIVKWIYYLNFMYENPEYFITGAQEEINNRAAHNVYIQMLYNLGILPVIIFTFTLFRSFIMLAKTYIKTLYYIVPFLFITLYVGELYELPFYIIISALIIGDLKYIYTRKKIN